MKKGKYGAVSISRISLAYIVRFYFFSLENEASRLSHRGLAIIECGGGAAVRRRIYCNNMHRGKKVSSSLPDEGNSLAPFLSSGQGILKLLLQEDAARRALALEGTWAFFDHVQDISLCGQTCCNLDEGNKAPSKQQTLNI